MKKKKVAFFNRVSTMDQHSSIENQDLIFSKWLENNKGYEVYKTYTDEGISGAKAYKRIEWLKMIDDGVDKKFDTLIAKSFSRFGRNQRETLEAISKLRIANIRIIFLEDNLDSQKDMQNFGLFSWLAEKEANATSERIKMVWDVFNKEGKIHVPKPAYGYDYNKEMKNFTINKDEAEVVKRIFTMYLDGNGFNSIANTLTEENVKTKIGGKWAGNTVGKMLINEIYIGTLVQGKTRTIDATHKENIKIEESEWYKHYNNHAAIIPEDVFNRVQLEINERSEKAKKAYTKEHSNSKRNSNKSLFSNILSCGECGTTMTVKRKKKDNYKAYYQCLKYDRLSLKSGHKSNRINEDELILILKKRFKDLSENNFKKLRKSREKIVNKDEKYNNNITKELDRIQSEIDKNINMSNNLLLLFTNGTIKEEQFKLQNASIEKSISVLVKKKEEINLKSVKDEGINKEVEKVYKDIDDILSADVEWTNSKLKKIIENIIVYIDGTIVLNLKYHN